MAVKKATKPQRTTIARRTKIVRIPEIPLVPAQR
jgi:hypothetical protein